MLDQFNLVLLEPLSLKVEDVSQMVGIIAYISRQVQLSLFRTTFAPTFIIILNLLNLLDIVLDLL
jgi:hypothetical protein